MPYNNANELLLRIAGELELWADESVTGGWSTHQVMRQRKLAVEIRNATITRRYESVLSKP